MGLRDYFDKKKGHGVLATADSKGIVDGAIYAKPYVVDDTTVAFIMADRLTRRNLLSNPHAAYVFIESGGGYQGKRLYLTSDKELRGAQVTDPDLGEKYRQACTDYNDEALSVMYFKVGKTLPLVVRNE